MAPERQYIPKSGVGFLLEKSIPPYMTTDPVQALRMTEDDAIEWKKRYEAMGLHIEIVELRVGKIVQDRGSV